MIGKYKWFIAAGLLAYTLTADAIVVRDRGVRDPGVTPEAVGVRPAAPGRYFYNGRYYRYNINGRYYNYYYNGQYYLYYNNGVYYND